jgi:N-acetylmuramoyl-L-alanine amidase
MALIFLDRQHAGKPGRKASDRGAVFDADGDGEIAVWESEAMMTPKYLLAAEERLIELGHDVICISDGWYSDRHARCNEYQNSAEGPCAYVSAHLNAGSGNQADYGAVFYDYRSTGGPDMATSIAVKLKNACPELEGGVKVIASTPDNWTKNAYNTIAGVAATAICFEPCFVDYDGHKPLLTDEGMERIGVALAEGLHDWLE